MGKIKCFDVLSMVIEEANERFNPLWQINNDNLKVLQQYCDVMDMVSDEFKGVSFDVEVDEITMEIKIELECEEIIIESKEHPLYELIKRAIKFGFYATDEDIVCVKLVFPSIWERT